MMATNLSPFVFWAQTEENVTLKVDLKDVKDPKIYLKENTLEFLARGRGARGLHDYGFHLNFHDSIIVHESDYKIYDSHIMITLKKTATGYWTKLISQPLKPAWLKIDFDRWTSEDASLDDDERVGDIRDDYPQVYDQLQKDERGYRSEDWRKVYLVVYNICQAVGFFTIFIVMSLRYAKLGADSITSTYDSVGNIMKLCTLFQILEVLHPIFGYTRSSVMATILQVGGRLLVLFAFLDAEPRMQMKPVAFYLFVVWTSVELVRYPYYICQLNHLNVYLITWLRYNVWMLLYPLGFLCEGIIYLRSLPYLEETGRFSIRLPNAWNFAFDMASFTRISLLFVFFPAMYVLMTQMYRERQKKLGVKKKQT